MGRGTPPIVGLEGTSTSAWTSPAVQTGRLVLEDRVILKENRVFAVSNASGDMPLGNDYGFGLYHLDTRSSPASS